MVSQFFKLRAAVGVMALAGCVTAQQAPPAAFERVTSVEGITEYKLKSNGLRVLLMPDPSKSKFTVNMTYMVGSRHENYGETGMAHLLEHLVFKGSPRHTNIPKELSDHGCIPNGSTWVDRTNYFETCTASDENLRWALDLEADRMVNSFIAKKDLDSEMTVVRNEFEMGETNPMRITMQRTMASMFEWHNYGKTTIGARSDIEGVNIERLQAFYRKFYQPDNAVLTIAGKIDEAKTLALVAELFTPVAKPTRVIAPTYTEEPVQDGERLVTIRRVGGIQVLMAGYHIAPATHPDMGPLNVLSTILSDDSFGRVYKRLVETKKATQNATWTFETAEPGAMLNFVILSKGDDIEDARKILLGTLEGFAKEPVTQEELDKAKQSMRKDFEIAFNDSEGIGLTLSEYISLGDWRMYFLVRDATLNAKLEDVQRVAVKYLKPSNRTLGMFIPEDKPDRTEVPKALEVSTLVKDYKGGTAVATGEAFDSSATNIDRRTKRAALANGMKTMLLAKKTRGEKVNVQVILRFGDEKSLFGKAQIGNLTGNMLDRGTLKHDKKAMKDELDRLKANVRVNGSATQAIASIETSRANLPEVLKLTAEMLMEPAFPATEFEEVVKQSVTGVENGEKEPQVVAMNAMARFMAPYPKGDVRYRPTPVEQIADIKAVKIEEMKAFHKQFYGAGNGQVAVVGDFDEAAVTPLLESLFGSWKSAAPYTRVVSPFKQLEPVNQSFQTPDKANAVFLATFSIQISDDNTDYPALALGNYILGGGFLNSRLASRIRGKEGLSYGVGAGFQPTPKHDNGNFVGNAILNPGNIQKVEKAFKEEMEKAFKEGFTKDEVDSAKKGWLQQRQVMRTEDQMLAATLANNAAYERTMAFNREVESKVDSLTVEQVNEVFKKYMDPKKLSIFKAGDFEKAGIKP
jgi:zinc protease